MIQKLALVILTVMAVTLIFNQPCNVNKHSKRRYPLFVTIDSSNNIKSDASVLLNGKEIGMVEEVKQAGDKKVFNMVFMKTLIFRQALLLPILKT